MRKSIAFSLTFVLMCFVSLVMSADALELSYSLGMKDGSENSDGVIVRFTVENGDSTVVSEEHWANQQWSDPFSADLTPWAGQPVTLKMEIDPGEERNTGWDWILISDAKITHGADVIFDINQAVADGTQENSMLLDGDDNETDGLGFGANCAIDEGSVGGETKAMSFMQHPPWDGRVGNTISRFEVTLPDLGTSAVSSSDKLSITWGYMKKI